MARIHIIGNSVAYGFDTEDRSWPALIKADTNQRRNNGQRPRISTVNLASPGNMLTHILESGLFEASVKCNQRGRQIGIFSVGSCEASILRSQNQTSSRRSKRDFSEDLDQLTELTEKLNANRLSENAVSVILLSTLPVDNNQSLCTPEGDHFNDTTILEYNDILVDKALQNDTALVDLRTDFNRGAMLARDGIHPNDKGDAFIYSKVMPAILSELGIRCPKEQLITSA